MPHPSPELAARLAGRPGAGPPATKRKPRRHLPVVTSLIIATCLGLFFYDSSTAGTFVFGDGVSTIGPLRLAELGDLTLFAPSIDYNGEWYRVITSGFVHFTTAHVGMNMLLLWATGRQIEGVFGALTFATIFVTGLLGGSLGALLLEPESQVGGASGAVFALLGATAVLSSMHGTSILRSGLGPLLAINIALSFHPDVSLGGHLGGLVAGMVCGALVGFSRRRGRRSLASVPVLLAAVGFGIFLAIIPAVERATQLAT